MLIGSAVVVSVIGIGAFWFLHALGAAYLHGH